jgi:flagellar protein FlbT
LQILHFGGHLPVVNEIAKASLAFLAAPEAAMALKVELKPGERIIVGDAVITNHDQRARFLIEGTTPILREKDIMTPALADTPAKRIYLAVQLMYTSRNPRDHHDVYFALVRDITRAAPSVSPYIANINNHILTGEMYKALKEARKLINYEQELLQHADRGECLRGSGKTDRKSAGAGSESPLESGITPTGHQ